MKRCPTCRRVYENQAAVCQVDGTALAEPSVNPDPFIGQMVTSRYRLVRKLGGTGLGVVYLAEEVATGNPVAVKLLLTEIRRDVELVKQFWWEARLAAASNPARIARVYEVDRTQDGRVFIAMEYLEGESLADLIRREAPLERGRALRLAIQIAEGLASASQAGVTHRNLKPQNVMLIGPDRVRLTDFGVGRLRETTLGGRPSSPNQIAPEYLAPEQLRGDEVNFRADIYALGAVLYTMLAGTVPAPPPGNGQEPVPLRKLRPEIPDAVEQFVLRAMEHRPERRHGGMEEVIERLRALTTHAGVEPAPAAPPSPAPAPSSVAALEIVSKEPPSQEPEPAIASLLTLLNDSQSPVKEWKAPAEWKLEGRMRRTGAILWFWCLGALGQARTGLTNAVPSVARWGSRFVLAVLGFIVLASQWIAALWQACRTWLARGWSYVAGWLSRLAALVLGAAGPVRRRSENLWVTSLDGWQRARTGTPEPQPDADPVPSRLSSWAFSVVGGFDRLRDEMGSRLSRQYAWWSYRGKLVVTGVAALVVVGVTTWALQDWTDDKKTKRPSPDRSMTADAGLSAAQLRELENERKREEARALRPIIPERQAETVAQVDEERRRQTELEATRRADEERRRQAELEASRRADEDRRRQAEVEAARRAENERRRAELEATRRADEERRQAEVEATRRVEDERRRAELETKRRADEERRRQAEAEAARRAEEQRRIAEVEAGRRVEEERRRVAEAEAARVRAEAARQIARPVEPAPAKPAATTLSAADLTRIRTQAEQKLQSRGLFRVSTADRWGVALEMGSHGEVNLSGTLRDMELYNEAVRLVREVPGVQAVQATNVRVADMGTAALAQGDAAKIRTEIQQRLRSRGLLRESNADRWGVTVEVAPNGEVTLAGMVRDTALQNEAIRLAQGVQGVQQVKQEIRVMESASKP